RGLDRAGQLFRFHDGGRLRDMLKSACDRAGVALPRRTAFHVFRHNYATWMRLYGGLTSQSSRPQLLTSTGTTAVHVSFNLTSASVLRGADARRRRPMKHFWFVAAAAVLLMTLLPDGAFAQRGGFRGAAIGGGGMGGGFRGAAI